MHAPAQGCGQYSGIIPPLHYFLAEKVEFKKVVLELVYTFVGLVKYFGLDWRTPDKVATTY